MAQLSTPQAINVVQEESQNSNIDVPLKSGRRISIEQAPEESIRVVGRTGEVELSVRLTDEGPKLSFTGADIDLASSGKVAIACDSFQVDTKQDVEIHAGGDLKTDVEGKHVITVKEAFELFADTLEMVAEKGDAVMKANDVVRMLGEKILLNSDKEEPIDNDKVVNFLERMGLNLKR